MIMHWLDTHWGCGAIWTEDGLVTDSAPIFKKLRGSRLARLIQAGYVVKTLVGNE